MNLDEILECVSHELLLMESSILEPVHPDLTLLNQVSDHILRSGGKRLRPALVILGARLFDCEGPSVRQAARAIEYLHTATLLHDDVIDGAEMRRSQKAASQIWGNNASVSSGDYLLASAFGWLTELRELDVLETISHATMLMAKGEILQLTRFHSSPEEVPYLEIIRNKTASLFASAMKIGAILGKASPQEQQSLYDYGMNLGIAFQIVDDALDYARSSQQTGKSIGTDLKERKITLPLRHLFQVASTEERLWLQGLLDAEMMMIDSVQMDRVIDLLESHDSLSYALQIAAEHAHSAQKNLADFPDSASKTSLLQLPHFIVTRTY